jgi:hypothetical protein
MQHHFAKVVHNSNGALAFSAEGEQFLRDCVDLQSPPPPFKCIQSADLSSHDHENHDHEAGGGVVGDDRKFAFDVIEHKFITVKG